MGPLLHAAAYEPASVPDAVADGPLLDIGPLPEVPLPIAVVGGLGKEGEVEEGVEDVFRAKPFAAPLPPSKAPRPDGGDMPEFVRAGATPLLPAMQVLAARLEPGTRCVGHSSAGPDLPLPLALFLPLASPQRKQVARSA